IEVFCVFTKASHIEFYSKTRQNFKSNFGKLSQINACSVFWYPIFEQFTKFLCHLQDSHLIIPLSSQSSHLTDTKFLKKWNYLALKLRCWLSSDRPSSRSLIEG